MVPVHRCNKEAEIAEIRTKINEIHSVMFQRDGLKERFDQMQGGLGLAKWAIGGGIMGIVSLIVVLMK